MAWRWPRVATKRHDAAFANSAWAGGVSPPTVGLGLCKDGAGARRSACWGGPQGRHGAGAQRTRPSMTSRLGLCRETTNGSLSVGLRMLETGVRSPVSLGLGAGVGGANVLEGVPGARPRRALPGAEGAVGSSAGARGGKAATPGGRSTGFPSTSCGLFPAASGTELEPEAKGGPSPRACQALCLPASRKGTVEPVLVLGRPGGGSHSLLPAGGVRSGSVHTHSVHTHAPLRPVAHTFPSFESALTSHHSLQGLWGALAPPAGDKETGLGKRRDLPHRPVTSSQTPLATGQAPQGSPESPNGSGEPRASQTA